MSIDGRFIENLANEINQFTENARINKIQQLSKTDFLFSLSTSENLVVSLSTSLARIHLTKQRYQDFQNPGGFCMFLRKHIEKGIIKNVESLNGDRIIEITVNNRNDIGDLTDYYLILEMFGRYANLIVLDNNRFIINAYKHIHPFEEIDRVIVNGAEYRLPVDDKIEPHDLNKIELFFERDDINYKDIINNIRGVSPLLAKYICKVSSYSSRKMFEVYKDLLEANINPTKSGKYFYYIDIFEEEKEDFSSISELLDYQFQKEAELDRVRQIHKYLHNFIKNQIEKDKNKLENLSKDLKSAENNQINRIKGDLLLQNNNLVDRTKSEVVLFSYELGEEVTVEIDPMACPIDNANKYFNKYKKQKNAIKFIKEQIGITKREITYFEDLLDQVKENHNIKDLEEIQEELIANKYLPKKKIKQKRKNLNYDTYIDDLGVQIVVGKNNLQNNFITHKLAKKDFMWFHVQNQSGSHTVVMSNKELEEHTIRTAANLAAIYSKSKYSSSVPVDYTKVKNVKKVPGETGSYVTYTNQKTIYIDPDMDLVKKIRKG